MMKHYKTLQNIIDFIDSLSGSENTSCAQKFEVEIKKEEDDVEIINFDNQELESLPVMYDYT